MSDKMLRIAGRSSDGKARAIRTDQNGNVGTRLTARNELATFQTTTVTPGQNKVVIQRFRNLENYSAVVIALSASANIDFRLQTEWHIKENEVYSGYGVMVHREDITTMKAQRFSTGYLEMKGTELSVLFRNDSTNDVSVTIHLIGIR